MGAQLKDIGVFLPESGLDNDRLAAEFPGTSAEGLYKLSGIRRRCLAADDQTPADLAFHAAETLFARNPDARGGVDAVLFCSEGLDYKAPATACLLHARLGLKPSCLALDIPSGCTGFVNGLLVAKGLIGSGGCTSVLLLTAEIPTRVIDRNDLHLRLLFGDGACASLIGGSGEEGIGQFVVGTDGTGARHLWVERSGFREPADAAWLEQNRHDPKQMKLGRMIMDGQEILHFSLTRVPQLIADTLSRNALAREDIDHFVFHQASAIILKALRKKCMIPDDKFHWCLEECGNTVSSSIPLALAHARDSGRIVPGQKVMLVSFGIGLAWAATVIHT